MTNDQGLMLRLFVESSWQDKVKTVTKGIEEHSEKFTKGVEENSDKLLREVGDHSGLSACKHM